MAYKFPSPEWLDHFVDQVNNSAAYANAAKEWEGDVLLVVEGHDAVYLDLWHGQCRYAEYLTDPKARQAEFTIAATLESWQKVLTRQLDPIQGMMTRQLKLEGNLVKVMKNVKAAQELVRCATGVATEF
jgi:putative sterol carrier protein